VAISPNLLVLASILGGPATGTLTLTASSGPVTHYAIAIPSSLIGRLSVTPSSGTIAPGQSTQVTVTVVGLLSVDTRLTVTPGAHSVTVLLGLSLAAAIRPAAIRPTASTPTASTPAPSAAAVQSPPAPLSPAAALNPAAALTQPQR
jgi:hypothetical protein